MVSSAHLTIRDTIAWQHAVELKLNGWQVRTVVSLEMTVVMVLLVTVDSLPTHSVVVAAALLKVLQVWSK
jgi:hypothetical protein